MKLYTCSAISIMILYIAYIYSADVRVYFILESALCDHGAGFYPAIHVAVLEMWFCY